MNTKPFTVESFGCRISQHKTKALAIASINEKIKRKRHAVSIGVYAERQPFSFSVKRGTRTIYFHTGLA